MMNYNWHKKFQKKSKVNHNELYLLGLAEQNKRKKELENQKKVKHGFLKNKIILFIRQSEEEEKKRELERGFVTYQRDYTDKSRPVSRVERPKSSARSLKSRGGTASNRKAYAEEPIDDSSPEQQIIQRPKSSRKSWADNLGIFIARLQILKYLNR